MAAHYPLLPALWVRLEIVIPVPRWHAVREWVEEQLTDPQRRHMPITESHIKILPVLDWT